MADKKVRRMYEVMKNIRLQSHEFGVFCNCKRLKCMEKVSENSRRDILNHFNGLGSHNEQNSYLCSLISLANVQRRRPRAPECFAKYHDSSYMYRVRIKKDNNFDEVQVCAKFFLAVHGISKSKLEYLQRSLKNSGVAPKDKRGGKNYKRLTTDILDCVKSHIASFKTRQSHYSLKDNKNRSYLPEDLNIKKMYRMFLEINPTKRISYQTYREVFKKKFNIGFGYPRTDTCSQCDQFNVLMKAAEKINDNLQEVKKLKREKELHLRKAQAFYDKKRNARKKARKEKEFECIAMDYQKNISLPNITTNDVYYKRQLSMFSFNIHVLSNAQSFFYTYPEYIAKKGANEVCSFLFDFCMNHLPREVEKLHIFCDGAGGQNKNYAFIRFTHYLVNVVRRFKSIEVTYPIRGHSYLECDKNMGLINTKARMETPSDWEQNIITARVKPMPFNVISVSQTHVKQWTDFFSDKYTKKCPFPVQKMREFRVTRDHPRMISHRDTYNGSYLQLPIISANQCKSLLPNDSTDNSHFEFKLPQPSYNSLIPIDRDKYIDLIFLSKFCESEEAKKLFADIPHIDKLKNKKNLVVQEPGASKRQTTSSEMATRKTLQGVGKREKSFLLLERSC